MYDTNMFTYYIWNITVLHDEQEAYAYNQTLQVIRSSIFDFCYHWQMNERSVAIIYDSLLLLSTISCLLSLMYYYYQ